MRRRRAAIGLLTGVLALATGCGSSAEKPEGGFDPSIAEDLIRNKARADVQANPILSVEDPEPPEVACSEGRADPEASEEGTVFTCDVRIVASDGSTLGRQRWEAEVEVDPATGDTVVRSSRRLESTIAPAPAP